MILDAGIARFSRAPDVKPDGRLPPQDGSVYYSAWYGIRTVSFRRFFEARQAGQRVDTVIRVLQPAPEYMMQADDTCTLSDNHRYKIVQIQPTRDEEAGEDALDLTLERMDGIWP